MPGGGFLNPGTVILISGSPTSISDVPFKIIKGSGQITHRTRTKDIITEVTLNSSEYFLSQGHKTCAPYDFGTLDPEYFEVIN